MARAAPLAARRHEAPPRREWDREGLGPTLFDTGIVAVGRWRCPADHPLFADSGPARGYLFVFPRTSVWIAHEGQPRFLADRATVTFYNRGQRYRRFAVAGGADHGEWFAVAAPVLADVLASADPPAADRAPAFAFTHGPSDRASYLAQRAVYEHVCRVDAPDALFVEETMLAVLGRVSRAARDQPRRVASSAGRTRGAAGELAERVRELLAVRYGETLSLRDVARAVDCSPFHLARLFRRATGTSLHRYRTELRLRAALDRLAEAHTDLLELALSLGYSSHSHFTEVFRTAFGLTPSEARRRLVGGRGRELLAGLATHSSVATRG
ncbi:MAG: helix-turn-helix transcriptional regulator [Vicinamibacterales bacterium]